MLHLLLCVIELLSNNLSFFLFSRIVYFMCLIDLSPTPPPYTPSIAQSQRMAPSRPSSTRLLLPLFIRSLFLPALLGHLPFVPSPPLLYHFVSAHSVPVHLARESRKIEAVQSTLALGIINFDEVWQISATA